MRFRVTATAALEYEVDLENYLTNDIKKTLEINREESQNEPIISRYLSSTMLDDPNTYWKFKVENITGDTS